MVHHSFLQVKAQFKRRSTANNVEIHVPVPDDADSPKFRAAVGSVHYAPEKSAMVWKIKQLGGGKEFLMRAHFGLPSVRNGESCSFNRLNNGKIRIFPCSFRGSGPSFDADYIFPFALSFLISMDGKQRKPSIAELQSISDSRFLTLLFLEFR